MYALPRLTYGLDALTLSKSEVQKLNQFHKTKAIHFSWLEPELFCSLVHRISTDDLLLLQISSGVV